jgi:hypothetical protein
MKNYIKTVKIVLIVSILNCLLPGNAKAQIIYTVAGNNTSAYSGDGGACY